MPPKNPLQLPEGTRVITPDGVEALIDSEGYVRPETVRKASGSGAGAGRSGFAAAAQELAIQHAAGGRIRTGASGPRRFG